MAGLGRSSHPPRRSVLFLPGTNARAQEKARELPADALILDLEDSVAPDAKLAARTQIAASLRAGGYGKRELVLRVNGAETPWQDDDLRFAAHLPIAAVLLPKVDGPDDVLSAEAMLAGAGLEHRMPLWAMMEVPLAFMRAEAIASSTPHLRALVMGTEDLGKDLRTRVMPDRSTLMTALQICVLAARAHGLDPLDSVSPDFKDLDAFTAACRQGRDLGFAGKTLIHPNQIAPANTAFAPNVEEIAAAQRVVEAYAAAKADGRAVASLDGRMIEQLHADTAQHVLDLGTAIAALSADH
ncbi:MAG TPA: CoA ester lyase [Stellaceae bacterium]|jgi:citrate lyase subunit beta/citryl-CoA lyase